MPTPSDSVTHLPYVASSQIGHSSHTTCPPDTMDRRGEYVPYVGDSLRHDSPGSESQPVDDPQHLEPEPSTQLDSTNHSSTLPKMPGALLYDNEDYLSSSSGEISEVGSGDSIDTVRPQLPEHGQSPMSLRQESASLPAAPGVHRLPRVRPMLSTDQQRLKADPS